MNDDSLGGTPVSTTGGGTGGKEAQLSHRAVYLFLNLELS